MNTIVSRTILIILFLFLGAVLAFSQGLYWESTLSTALTGSKAIPTASYYRPHMFKQSSEKQATIFRLDKGILYIIDNERKEYSEMTFAELEAQAKEAGTMLDAQMAEMKKRLANMPPEQQKMVEQLMGDKLKGGTQEATVEVSKSSEAKTISGYACTKYILQENGKESGSVWTTTSVSDFDAMREDFKEFAQRLGALVPSKGSQIATAMKQIDGFPIETSIGGMTTTVTKIEKRPVPETEFSVPSGYKKVKSELMKDHRRGHRPDQKPNDEEQKEQE